MAKTTRKDFEIFKKEFLRWVDKFGLKGYRLLFHHEPLDDNYAEILTSEESKTAIISLNSKPSKNAYYYKPQVHAKHEAIHLFLSRFQNLAGSRYLQSDDITEEVEKLVRILEKIL
jgi:hypothetical protein